MVFNSFQFLVFFPIIVVIYFIIPKRLRYIWLLAASYYFYMSWNARYALLIALSTVITYASGLLLGRTNRLEEAGKRAALGKWIVAVSFVINLGILFFFKYFDFALSGINLVLGHLGMSLLDKPFNVLLPVGISFYTFQALSYTADVYRGVIEPEKNLLRYALFVSFFPQLVAGPIERSGSLLKQIQGLAQIRLWNYERITSGLAMMLWGYFMKMVIADRLAIFVDTVYTDYQNCGSGILIVAAIFFAIQIYCDFGSYSIIAIGSAKVMGVTLMENFNTPHFSHSIQEFWRRWHISLSTWFKDYLYIPLGGSRRGRARRYLNLMITFLASGLWHGASLHYVVWGGLHGCFQIIGDVLRPYKKKLADRWHIHSESLGYRLWQCCVTFLLIAGALVFFRSPSLTDALGYMGRIVSCTDFGTLADGSLFAFGLGRAEMLTAVLAILLLLCVDLIRYYKSMQLDEYLNTRPIWLRWGAYLFLLGAIVIFGIYGTTYDAAEFIYFQF